MVVPPSGDPSGGEATASAGDNQLQIRVPDSEEWILYSVAGINETNVVRIRFSLGFGGQKAVFGEGIQGSVSEHVVWSGMIPLPSGEVLTIDFLDCVLNDVLKYNYYIDRRFRAR